LAKESCFLAGLFVWTPLCLTICETEGAVARTRAGDEG
jgi:hypothetical protein